MFPCGSGCYRHGKAVYLADELSYFRMHENQEQRKPDVAFRCLTERYTIISDAREIGFLKDNSKFMQALKTVYSMYTEVISNGQLQEGDRMVLEQYRADIAGKMSSLGVVLINGIIVINVALQVDVIACL